MCFVGDLEEKYVRGHFCHNRKDLMVIVNDELLCVDGRKKGDSLSISSPATRKPKKKKLTMTVPGMVSQPRVLTTWKG